MTTKFLILLLTLLFSKTFLGAQGDLDDGIFWGYQAWHLAPNDGRTVNSAQWYHWFDDLQTGNILGVDMYPDMTEYPVSYPTNLKYPDGATATLYSAFDYETIDLHIKWMKDYGIKGCFLQRQNANISSGFQLEFRDTVTRHVIKACEKYGVKFCMMPCNNDKNTGGQQMVDKLINDWKHCVDNLKVLESPMYMQQNEKPVIGFWGLGFDNRPMLASEAHEVLDFFQNKDGNSAKYEVYVMAGVPVSWRTSPKEGGWDEVFLRCDMISPWRTLFATQGDGVSISTNFIERMREDMDYCKANNIDYNPVVSPGASTATQHDKQESFNWKKRSGGQFLWNQVYEVIKAYEDKNIRNTSIYGAMFDEVDEGTAIYKLAITNEEAPTGTKYEVCTLDEDGYDLPSDWYLQLAGEAQKMIDGRIPLSKTMSIDPNNPVIQEAYMVHTVQQADTALIQAEDFDRGGEGIAYHDKDSPNNGGSYRPEESVDIEAASDAYIVGWIEADEWLEYTLTVQDSGSYDFVFRAASEYDDRSISLSIDNTSIATVEVASTGSDTLFGSDTKISGVSLAGGQRLVRLSFNNTMKFDFFEIGPVSSNDTTANAISLQADNRKNMLIYPNPSSSSITLDLKTQVRGAIEIRSLNGQLIHSRSIQSERELIDLSIHPEGIYFVTIRSDAWVKTEKVVKY